VVQKTGKLRREEKPLIPPDALRAILVNAIIHRDYGNVGGCITNHENLVAARRFLHG
jgi:predicted HTH transcriptional regulator